MELFRPVGLEELCLVYEADLRAFPPRLPDQPIFYPVTNAGYATQIAREWNTQSGTLAGFVTRFVVADGYAARFERRVVGAREHEELWVPADELAGFNAHLEGRIEVIGAHFGAGYAGEAGRSATLGAKTAHEQLVALVRALRSDAEAVVPDLVADRVAVFLNFFFWEQASFLADGIDDGERDACLATLRRLSTERIGSAGLAPQVPRPAPPATA